MWHQGTTHCAKLSHLNSPQSPTSKHLKYTYTPRNIDLRTPDIYVPCNIKHKKDTRDLHTANQDTKALHTFQHQTQKGHQRFTHYKSGYQSSTHFSTSEHERSAHSATSGHQRSARCTTSRHRDLHVVHDQDTRALHNTQHMILDIYAMLKIRMPRNAHCAIQMLETCTMFNIKIPKTSGSGMSEIPVCGECLRTAKIQTDTGNRRVRTAETNQNEGWRRTLEIQKQVCKWRWGGGGIKTSPTYKDILCPKTG